MRQVKSEEARDAGRRLGELAKKLNVSPDRGSEFLGYIMRAVEVEMAGRVPEDFLEEFRWGFEGVIK